jgi:hypothetical protein
LLYNAAPLQEEEAAIAALLGEEVDTSSILAAAAALPDLSEDVAEAAADAAARGGPLPDAAVQVSVEGMAGCASSPPYASLCHFQLVPLWALPCVV